MKVFGNYFAFRISGEFLSLPPQSLKLKECFDQSPELSVQKTLRPKVVLVEILRIGGRPRSGLDFSQVCIWQFCIFSVTIEDQSDMAKMSKGRYASSSLDEYRLFLATYTVWENHGKSKQKTTTGRSFSAHVRKSRAEIEPLRHLDAVGKVVMQRCEVGAMVGCHCWGAIVTFSTLM